MPTNVEKERKALLQYLEKSHIYNTVKRHVKSYVIHGKCLRKDIYDELHYCLDTYQTNNKQDKAEEIKVIMRLLFVYDSVKNIYQSIDDLFDAGFTVDNVYSFVEDAVSQRNH